MSTILKALENSKNSAQIRIIEPSSDRNWKIIAVAAILVIAMLLAVVSFLLFKTTKAELAVSSALPMETMNKVVIPAPQEEIIAPLFEVQEEQPVSLVSEVNFKTKPLPLTNKSKSAGTPQKWVSPNKPIRNISATTPSKETSKVPKKTTSESNEVALSGVSKDLQRRFAMAVEYEDKKELSSFIEEERPIVGASDITSMPVSFQFQVPDMRYDSHVYSSDEKDRWIRINGVDLLTGDFIGEVELIEILPQQSLFRLNNQHFTLESLQDWEG